MAKATWKLISPKISRNGFKCPCVLLLVYNATGADIAALICAKYLCRHEHTIVPETINK